MVSSMLLSCRVISTYSMIPMVTSSKMDETLTKLINSCLSSGICLNLVNMAFSSVSPLCLCSTAKGVPGFCIQARLVVACVYYAFTGKVIPPTFTLTAAISRPVMDSTAFFTPSCTALPTSGMVLP